MSDLWKQCEGLLVDNQFPLVQFLASTNHSAVFLTKLTKPTPRKAAIKFISADVPAPEEQLSAWARAAQLNHPHLLPLLDCGRCRIQGMELLYVITEHADENLSQLLPQRPLRSEEAREMLAPLVDVLGYLHRKGFAHGHIKPSNLLAVADQFKLSGDTLLTLGDSREAHRDRDSYDPPESSASSNITASAAADVWSVGVTLVESLTQQTPTLPFDDTAEPSVPSTLPQPFLEIAHHTLLRDPSSRWTVPQIADYLYPVSLSAAAGATATSPAPVSPSAAAPAPPVSPSVPRPNNVLSSISLSSGPAGPVAKLSAFPITPRVPSHAAPKEPASTLPSYVVPMLLGVVLLFGVILVLPKLFTHFPQSSAATGNPTPAKPLIAQTKSATAKDSASLAANSSGSLPSSSPSVRVPQPTPPVALFHANSAAAALAKASASSPDRGEVLDQILPQVPPKALATINGTVRVLIRVHVDAAGNVSSAELDAPGPSKYFAELAVRAAEQWQFASPVSEGRSFPSEWVIRFEFTRNGPAAFPSQSLP